MPKDFFQSPNPVKNKTKLIKTQIKCYLKDTRSNDIFEIRSHCQRLINNVSTSSQSTSQLHNWFNQQLLQFQHIHSKCQQPKILRIRFDRGVP